MGTVAAMAIRRDLDQASFLTAARNTADRFSADAGWRCAMFSGCIVHCVGFE